MKRFLCIAVIFCLFISLVACGKYTQDGNLSDNDYNSDSFTSSEFVDDIYDDGIYDDAPTVEYISNRSIQNNGDEGYVFLFSFLDENENEIKSSATVNVRIVNDAGSTVYTATKNITEEDFSTWSNQISGRSWLKAAIYINFNEISKGTTAYGTFYYQITSSSGVSFDEFYLDVNGLPIEGSTVTLPSVPRVIHDYDYNDEIETSVEVTDITYEIKNDDLYIYFTGEKTYDDEGSGYSRACHIGWKLYDSEGYIKDSGTFYSPAIKVGEKFRHEKAYAFDVITPGENYELVIENVD